MSTLKENSDLKKNVGEKFFGGVFRNEKWRNAIMKMFCMRSLQIYVYEPNSHLKLSNLNSLKSVIKKIQFDTLFKIVM